MCQGSNTSVGTTGLGAMLAWSYLCEVVTTGNLFGILTGRRGRLPVAVSWTSAMRRAASDAAPYFAGLVANSTSWHVKNRLGNGPFGVALG
jgi:hypothetical protein